MIEMRMWSLCGRYGPMRGRHIQITVHVSLYTVSLYPERRSAGRYGLHTLLHTREVHDDRRTSATKAEGKIACSRQSKSLGALRWSGCEVGLCERVDDDRLAFRGRGDAGMPTSVPVVR